MAARLAVCRGKAGGPPGVWVAAGAARMAIRFDMTGKVRAGSAGLSRRCNLKNATHGLSGIAPACAATVAKAGEM